MRELIVADWPAPAGIHAVTTTRLGGVSQPPFDSLNLGDHVGDNPQAVTENRQRLRQIAALPAEPLWLQQTHSTQVINAADWQPSIEADAIVSDKTNRVCAILTADCLPICLYDQQTRKIAAIHAGWRGLAGGIIEKTIAHMQAEITDLIAWLGPAIGPQQFEVGSDVYEVFTQSSTQAVQAFSIQDNGRYLADIYQLARQRLTKCGVEQISGGEHCTVSDPATFYSYRRDGQTGRMATLIWRT